MELLIHYLVSIRHTARESSLSCEWRDPMKEWWAGRADAWDTLVQMHESGFVNLEIPITHAERSVV